MCAVRLQKATTNSLSPQPDGVSVCSPCATALQHPSTLPACRFQDPTLKGAADFASATEALNASMRLARPSPSGAGLFSVMPAGLQQAGLSWVPCSKECLYNADGQVSCQSMRAGAQCSCKAQPPVMHPELALTTPAKCHSTRA